VTKPTALHLIDGTSADTELGRVLPQPRSRQVVLGAIMLAPPVLAEVRQILDGSEFYRPAHWSRRPTRPSHRLPIPHLMRWRPK
jgi:hypothetical protein